jgi:hypothetical protein
MSRVVNPRAYGAMIRSLNPSSRVCPFAHNLRFETASAAARHLQVNRASLSEQRLRRGAVARVTPSP